jgi:outer membrane protein assembly factor BamB
MSVRGARRLVLLAPTCLGVLGLLAFAGLPLRGTTPLSPLDSDASAAVPSAAQAPPALHVVPFPGTPDASPYSQIIFSSLLPSDLKKVIVTGSSSHIHTGSLTALPDHAGTAFVPVHPFTAGEMVTVQALLSSRQAGTAEGDPGAMSLSWSFTVRTPPPQASATDSGQRPSTQASGLPHRVFRSEPRLFPPPVRVSSGPAPGNQDIFVSPRSHGLFVAVPKLSSSQSGLMILNPRGQLLWFRSLGRELGFNLEVQRYRGQPVLTYFEDGHGYRSQDVILNSSYQTVAVLKAGWGYLTDLHDFQITPEGTALVDAIVTVKVNLTSVGGSANGLVVDDIIQKLDIPTGRVLWEWHALGHISLSASEVRPPKTGVYDAYHLNSVQQLPGQRLLVSIRHAWAVYEIDERTGRVIWTLGGRHSSFKMGPGTQFQWQHDAHLQGNLLTLLDNADAVDGSEERPQSSAKELRINTRTRTVSLVHTYRHWPPLLTGAEGSAQLLSNHDLFVGWGMEPRFSQYSPTGRQIFDAAFPLGVDSYRAYRFNWTAHPLTPPALAVSRGRPGRVWLYASWNGATQVASWRVLGGSSTKSLTTLKQKPWTGFETAIRVHTADRYFAVKALNSQGKVLGRSDVVTAPAG